MILHPLKDKLLPTMIFGQVMCLQISGLTWDGIIGRGTAKAVIT